MKASWRYALPLVEADFRGRWLGYVVISYLLIVNPGRLIVLFLRFVVASIMSSRFNYEFE